jgi:hypothetical protein
VPDFYADPVSERLAKGGAGGWEHGWVRVGKPGSMENASIMQERAHQAAHGHLSAIENPAGGREPDAVFAAMLDQQRQAAGEVKFWHPLHSDPVIDRLTEVLSKVGPKGYIHGWIYVGTGTGGRADHPDLGHGTVTRAGSKDVHVRFGSGEEADFARRDAKPGESEGLKRTGLSSQYTSTGKPTAGDVDQLIANYRTMHGKDPSAAQIAQLRRKASRG